MRLRVRLRAWSPADKPSQFVKELPPAIDRIFERCFARQERRYADAAEVLLDLKAAVLDLPPAPLGQLFPRLATENLEAAMANAAAAEEAPETEPSAAVEEVPEHVVSVPAPEVAQEPEEPEGGAQEEAPQPKHRPPLEELMAAQEGPDEGTTQRGRLAEPPLSA